MTPILGGVRHEATSGNLKLTKKSPPKRATLENYQLRCPFYKD